MEVVFKNQEQECHTIDHVTGSSHPARIASLTNEFFPLVYFEIVHFKSEMVMITLPATSN